MVLTKIIEVKNKGKETIGIIQADRLMILKRYYKKKGYIHPRYKHTIILDDIREIDIFL